MTLKISQQVYTSGDALKAAGSLVPNTSVQLVLTFGGTEVLEDAACFATIQAQYPQALVVGCSAAGEIYGTRVLDDGLVVTAVEFEHTRLELARAEIGDAAESFDVGRRLALTLPHEELTHVLVLSEGLTVNGTALVGGLRAGLPERVGVTGGLSGDGEHFARTLVCADEPAKEGRVAALGLYGDRLKVGCGSLGGWDPFGPERLITRSKGNVLYELDDQSALELYKKYLGPHAAGLPATGLLFPLALRNGDSEQRLVRTILAVDEAQQSMTFAGDIPQGAYACLMKSNVEHLIEGARGAAQRCQDSLGETPADLAIVISCVGRKLLLRQRTEEELEGVQEVLGQQVALAGFYSYGELAPEVQSGQCELHNQTITITTLTES